MDSLKNVLEMFLHLDEHLLAITSQYGAWAYAILFTIIFCETGLVVTPFLPGDSLLFAAGAIAGLGALKFPWVYSLLLLAAVGGDNMNYWIGRFVGPRVFTAKHTRWFNRRHLERTHAFFERHGVKAVILARFVPIVRTFMPFVAGIGRMSYRKYFMFDVIGGLSWVTLFVGGGYLFGNLPFVKANFSFMVLGIIALSLAPIGIEFLKHRRRRAE